MNIVGIDFGHGETSAAIVKSERVIENHIPTEDLFIVGEKKVIPSIICLMPSGEYVIDPTAYQIAKSTNFGICFKAPILGNERHEIISSTNKELFQKFITLTYESIISGTDNPLHSDINGNRDFNVYIACPSGWTENQIKAYKSFIINTCKIPVADIVKESRAAYIATRRKVSGGIRTQGGNTLVIDFGSSTVDFTYFNNNSNAEPIHEGYPLGASRIEEILLEYLNSLEWNHDAFDAVYSHCGDVRGKNTLLYEIRVQKEDYFTQQSHDYFELAINLRDLMLDRSFTGQYIESVDTQSSDRGLTKSAFLRILSPYINELSTMLNNFKSKRGVTTIDRVILTGGASRMFFFKELVEQHYGVSKEAQTLIVDLEPSLTISQGIAAYGYMNEVSTGNERTLWDDVNEWIDDELPGIVRNALNSALCDIYYNEYTNITEKYRSGDISEEGKRSIYALSCELEKFLNTYSTDSSRVGRAIADRVQNSVSNAVNTSLTKYANAWGYQIEGVNISFDFNSTFCMTEETVSNHIKFIIYTMMGFIEKRDLFGTTGNTPYKDRVYSDRDSIVTHLNSKIRDRCSKFSYDGSLDSEINVIARVIRREIQKIVNSAKLEMYK